MCCAIPDGGANQTLSCINNIPPSTTTLTPLTAGGTWSNKIGNPSVATFSGNTVSGMNNIGTYTFIYTVLGGTYPNYCNKDTVLVEILSCSATCVKPNAGTDQAPTCVGNTAITTATLAATAVAGGAWTQVATNPAGAVVTTPSSATSGITGLTSGTYQFIWATSATCSDTVKITIPNCAATCTKPTFKLTSTPATCLGNTTNNDAKIIVNSILNGDKAAYSQGSTYTGGTYSVATAISGGAITFANISITTNNNNIYTVRIFNGSDACFEDKTIIIPISDCNTLCTIDAGNDMIICKPVSTVDLKDAAATEEWIIGSGNPAGATINATTGVVSGMTADGIYSFILRDKVNTSCSDIVYIFRSLTALPTISSCDATFQLPTDGSVTWTIAAGNTASVTAAGFISGMTTDGIYTFNASFGTCSATIDIVKITCVPLCTKPNAGTDQAPTCVGNTAITTATLAATAVAGGAWTQVATNPAGAVVTTPSSATSGITGLTSGTYQFIWATSATCSDTVKITIPNCSATCVKPNAGLDVTICLPKTTSNLIDAPVGYQWTTVAGNPAAAVINATTGIISGMTIAGTYTFRLAQTTDATCFDEIQVIVTIGDQATVLCRDGSTSYTLLAEANTSNVAWYNMAGVQVGTGNSLIVNANLAGLEDGSEAFYYTAKDTSNCDAELCCPVKFVTQNCCPVPNCMGVTVIKK